MRYTLSEELDALSAVFADEVHEVRAGEEAAVQARAWTDLRLLSGGTSAPPPPEAVSLEAALAALPPSYRALPLPLQSAPPPAQVGAHVPLPLGTR